MMPIFYNDSPGAGKGVGKNRSIFFINIVMKSNP